MPLLIYPSRCISPAVRIVAVPIRAVPFQSSADLYSCITNHINALPTPFRSDQCVTLALLRNPAALCHRETIHITAATARLNAPAELCLTLLCPCRSKRLATLLHRFRAIPIEAVTVPSGPCPICPVPCHRSAYLTSAMPPRFAAVRVPAFQCPALHVQTLHCHHLSCHHVAKLFIAHASLTHSCPLHVNASAKCFKSSPGFAAALRRNPILHRTVAAQVFFVPINAPASPRLSMPSNRLTS